MKISAISSIGSACSTHTLPEDFGGFGKAATGGDKRGYLELKQ
jgi:hypothetical protein